MKILTFLALLLLVCSGCYSSKSTFDAEKQNFETLVIQYEANTRGFYQKLVVQNHTISTTNDRNGKKNPIVQKISDADWNALIFEFNKVDLDGLPNLKAPTEKRFYDGAAIAGLKITFKGKTFETTNFDHGFPPMEIQKVAEIVTLLFKAEQ
jgi:hypothetical protein